MLMFPFPVVVVRMMPSDFESPRCDGNSKEPPSDENGEYQGQRSDVHKPSPTKRNYLNREPGGSDTNHRRLPSRQSRGLRGAATNRNPILNKQLRAATKNL
jgi:hypothetical protein